jgi:four helix bundle protein
MQASLNQSSDLAANEPSQTSSAIPHSAFRTPNSPSGPPDLKKRTKAFALRILKLVDALPKTTAGRALASQIVRSGTSVAANYRAACRAKSPADSISKMGNVEEEADETLFWLELLEESALVRATKLTAIKQEANELIAITVASIKTTRRNRGPNSAFPNSEFQ